MTNTLFVCLITLFCCSNLSFARQAPKECSKGPSVWCESLKRAADCGAVGHCTSTVWEKKDTSIEVARTPDADGVYQKIVRLFEELKDVRELINEEYITTRVSSVCQDIQYPSVAKICKENTAQLTPYIFHVLKSDTAPVTLCQIIGICDNGDVNHAIEEDTNNKGPKIHKEKLLGAAQCTWGPSYWCSNFSTGRECKATHHCVSKVWSKMTFPEDDDSICKICTDMVQQARDQLQSNETQEELKEVFEGSCQLIPIKVVAKECMKLADDFVPELVETLASQMNPQAVCSVAGLCNNVKIDDLLERFNNQLQLRAECNNCHKTVGVLRKKFDTTGYEDFLVGLLQMCRRMDSLSDSCSMLVFQYYENIVEAIKKDLVPQSVCHVTGQCAYKFHSHDEFTFPNTFTDYKESDDVPCEFCEQLVKHLRDVLVANTTEIEFAKVLKGLCKQTGKFKDECLHLADEYYPLIYKFLTEDLKGRVICSMIGMCGNTTDEPIAPMVPHEMLVKVVTSAPKLVATKLEVGRVPVSTKQSNVRVIQDTTSLPPLPLERMFVAVPQPQGKAACSFCQYFLHYLQVEISDTHTEDEIMTAVDKACERLPKSVNEECQQFVTQYGPSVIALLVQQIDPASVCPALGICPQTQEVKRVDINAGASNCPLCLFAVEQLETMLKNNRTEQSIRNALDNLCTHLSAKMRTQCVDFVDQYTNQLVEMLVANMDAQEVCVFLKLCKDEVQDPLKITHSSIDKYHDKPQLRGDRNNFRRKSMLPTEMLVKAKDVDIETNEIQDNTVNGLVVRPPVAQKSVCVICEFVLKEIDDQIKDKHNDDEIKKIVHGVCKHMPKSVRSQCDQFVEKYADLVISLLAQELDPSEVCEELKLCDPSGKYEDIDAVKGEILDCAVCETVVMAVKKVLSNDKVDHNIVHIVEKSCGLLPAKYNARCHTLMEIYGDSVIHLIETFGTKGVCQKIGLCSPSDAAYVRMYRDKRN